MRLLALVCLGGVLWAGSYTAKVEPINSVTLKAAAAGAVIEAPRRLEGTRLQHTRIVRLDDAMDRKRLQQAQNDKVLLERMIALNEATLEIERETAARQKRYYERMRHLSTASQTQKDNAFNAYAAAQNRANALEEKILSLRQQLNATETTIAQLKDTIDKKNVVASGYLFRLMVRQGEYVAPGTPLARVDRIDKAKLVIYVSREETDDIKKKRVFLNGNPTEYRVSKVWRVTDDTYLSSYRVEIDINASDYRFGDLVNVELK